MGFLRVLTVAALLLCWAPPVHAQRPLLGEQPVPVQPRRDQPPVDLQVDAGRVNLSAQNVPVRVILTEWARLGGATIVNGDRVGGPPVTIELADVPERQELGILLRSVAGYMLAPRRIG